VKKKVITLLSVFIVGLCGILPGITAFAVAPDISGIQESSITKTSAVISWTTDIDSTGQVRYGTAPSTYDAGDSPVASIGGNGKTHLVNLTSLAANTTYYYVVDAIDGGDTTTSAEGSFTTKAFTISGVTSSNITSTAATITWNTDALTTSNVDYGLTTGYGSSAPAVEDATADSLGHSVALTGLTPNTLYHYQVKSKDASANEEVYIDMTFSTQADLPPVISSVLPDGITIGTDSSATINWDTNEAASSQVEYGTTSSTHGNYTSTTPLDATQVTSHSVLLGALTPGTTYYYRVISVDAFANESTSAEYSFTTATDNTQPVISSVTAGTITTSSATITWSTNENASSRVDYGLTTVPYESFKTDATLVVSHQILLTGLTPNTTYHYRVRSTDAYTNEATWIDKTFVTQADSTAPVISNIQKTGITDSSITITWSTNEPASSQLEYGLTAGYGSQTALNAILVTNHSVSISGLADGTTFHFSVKSADIAGNPAASADDTFATLDTTQPTVPGTFTQTTADNDNTPTFTWVASTDTSSGIDKYEFRVDGGAWTDLGDVTVYQMTVALDDGAHTINVRAVDVAGNPGNEAVLNIDIDATNPTAVSALVQDTAGSDNTPTFSWTAATDATSGIAKYQVKMDAGAWVDHTTAVTYTYGVGLADGSHTFYVRAVDVAGNAGAEESLVFTIDIVAPSAPTSLARTSAGNDNTPAFSWTAATDATSGIANYQVRMDDGAWIDYTDDVTYTYGVALTDGAHTLDVRAVDVAGNVGTETRLAFTTDAVLPSEVSNLQKTTPSNDNTPTITWTAATDATSGIASYDIKINDGAWTDIGDVTTYDVTTALDDGSNDIEVRAVDGAGNVGAAAALAIIIDSSNPSAPSGLTKSTGDNDNTPTFTWSAATDALSGISRYQVKIDTGDWVDSTADLTYTHATQLADGEHTVYIRAVDNATNVGTDVNITFTLDTTAPTAPANVAITTGGSDTTPTFTWDVATDVTAGVVSYEVRIGTGEFADVGNVLTYTVADGDALVAGSYTFEVRAVDAAGNRSAVSSVAFQISGGGLPVWVIILIVVVAVAGAAGVFFWVRRSAKFSKS